MIHRHGFESIGVGLVVRSIGRSVEVNVSPTAIDVMPDSGFFSGRGLRLPIDSEKLRQSCISHNGNIPDQPDVWRANRALPRAFFFQIEIEAMKLQTFDQMADSFRFEGGEISVAQIDVGAPISSIDGC